MKTKFIYLLATAILSACAYAQSSIVTINPSSGQLNIPSGTTPNFDPISTSTGLVDVWDVSDINNKLRGSYVSSFTGRKGRIATSAAAHTYQAAWSVDGPIYDMVAGHFGLVCDGSRTLFTTDAHAAAGTYNGFAICAVVYPYGTSNFLNNDCIASWGDFGSPSTNLTLWTAFSGTANPSWVANSGNDHMDVSKFRDVVNRPTCLIYTYDPADTSLGSNGTVRLWINGANTNATAASGTTQTVDGHIGFGNYSFNGTKLVWYLYAGWNRPLKVNEVDSINTYCQRKFIEDSRRTLWLLGDSIYEGNAAVTADKELCNDLQAAFPNLRVVNAARGGQTMSAQASGTAPYDWLYGKIKPGDICVLGAPSIDIDNTSGDSLGTIEANVTLVVDQCNKGGAAVIVPQMLPRGAYPNQSPADTRRASYNTYIATPANVHAADYVDISGVSGLSANNDWQSTINFVTQSGTFTGADASGGNVSIDTSSTIYPVQNQRVAQVYKTSDMTDETSHFEGYISATGHLLQTDGSNTLNGVGLTVVLNDGAHPQRAGNALLESVLVPKIKAQVSP